MALVPVVTYFPFFILGTVIAPPSSVLKQGVTNQVLVWALLNAILTLLAGFAFKGAAVKFDTDWPRRSEEHTSELQSLMRISYAVFCLKKKNKQISTPHT